MNNVIDLCSVSIDEKRHDLLEQLTTAKENWVLRDMYWRNKELEKRPRELLELIEDDEERLLFCGDLIDELIKNKDYSDAALNMIELYRVKKEKVNKEIAENLADLEFE